MRIKYAEKSGFRSRNEKMSVTTLGGDTKVYESLVYDCKIRDKDGRSYEFEAFGLESVTGYMGQLVMPTLKKLFPRVTGQELADLQRKVGGVDYLIGNRNPSWHPDKEVRAEGGGDLWLYRSLFGSCLGGNHSEVRETTARSKSIFVVNRVLQSSHVHAVKTAPLGPDMFFQLESLGTCVDLKCGGCKCTKCPVPGSRYSFQEQQQLDMIQRNLSYDEEAKVWTARLPWVTPREALPDNYNAARKAMEVAERSLKKRDGWLEVYSMQVKDMVDRGAARKLTPEEVEAWDGVVHYIPHLVVENPASQSTPVRLVFDGSRPQGPEKVSLNDCLAKGPDNYINNLCGVLLGFRTEPEAAKGDIKKFYNATRLVEEDTHCQRFLW